MLPKASSTGWSPAAGPTTSTLKRADGPISSSSVITCLFTVLPSRDRICTSWPLMRMRKYWLAEMLSRCQSWVSPGWMSITGSAWPFTVRIEGALVTIALASLPVVVFWKLRRTSTRSLMPFSSGNGSRMPSTRIGPAMPDSTWRCAPPWKWLWYQ
ncbi:hypothetical protein D9M72_553280 [compost metagenome]